MVDIRIGGLIHWFYAKRKTNCRGKLLTSLNYVKSKLLKYLLKLLVNKKNKLSIPRMYEVQFTCIRLGYKSNIMFENDYQYVLLTLTI